MSALKNKSQNGVRVHEPVSIPGCNDFKLRRQHDINVTHIPTTTSFLLMTVNHKWKANTDAFTTGI